MTQIFPNPKEVAEGLKQPGVRKAMARLDFRIFVIAYFTHYIKQSFAPFHLEMMQDIDLMRQGKIDELLWVMFRGSAKTALAKMYVLWCTVFNFKEYIIIDSYALQNSENFLFDIAIELQTNRLLIHDYGQLYNEAEVEHKTKKRVGEFITKNKVKLEAVTTQKPLRGRVQGEQRPDLIVFDDIENLVTVSSATITGNTWDHMGEAITGLAPEGQILYLGNYISDVGIIDKLLKRCEHKRLVPAIHNLSPTWPTRFTLEEDEEGKINLSRVKEKVGPMVFDREYMNIPHSEADRMFKQSYFVPIEKQEVNHDNTYITVDPAATTAKQSDFTGITINHRHDGFWNIECLEVKHGPLELIDMLFALNELHKPIQIGIEETMYTQAIKPFLEQEMRKRKVFLPIVTLKHGGRNKEKRIQGLEPLYASGTIRHIRGCCDELEAQLLRFPHVLHDDVLDSLAYQLDLDDSSQDYEDYDEYYEKWSDAIGI